MTTKTKKIKPVVKMPLLSTIAAENKDVLISDIDFSPLNYRKYISETLLEEFAKELALHGMILPILLREMASGRYELIAGERRLRASTIAGFKTVPAKIQNLTDDQVVEIQLAENLQREDPHPMHEAHAVGRMQDTGKSIAEIAARLGKSKAFVYSRIKLLSLVQGFKQIFLAGKIDLTEAFLIASLSCPSQEEFFESHCTGWEKKKDFRLYNLEHFISRFRYDLSDAPFDTKDKTLVPEAGACAHCPSNTATLKSLFPELAKESVCNNKECFAKKCAVHISWELTRAFEEHRPDALLFAGEPLPELLEYLSQIHGADTLPRYDWRLVSAVSVPELPDKKDFTGDSGNADGPEPDFDEESYNEAMQDFETDREEYDQLCRSGGIMKGLLVTERRVLIRMFSPAKPGSGDQKAATSKSFMEATKSGSISKELLQAEIDRLNTKEKRSLEIDQDKIQINIHQQFGEQVKESRTGAELTPDDLTGTRLIVYQSLDYSSRCEVDKILLAGKEPGEDLTNVLAQFTDGEYACLIRMSVLGNSQSKYPCNENGRMLRKIAESAGLNTRAIIQEQDQKANKRQLRLQERIADLEKQIQSMESGD